MLTVSQSNATGVQVLREQLTALISANYPEVRSLKVKNGWYYSIRARFKGGRIYAIGRSSRRAIIKFFEELNQKVYLQPYIEA